MNIGYLKFMRPPRLRLCDWPKTGRICKINYTHLFVRPEPGTLELYRCPMSNPDPQGTPPDLRTAIERAIWMRVIGPDGFREDIRDAIHAAVKDHLSQDFQIAMGEAAVGGDAMTEGSIRKLWNRIFPEDG